MSGPDRAALVERIATEIGFQIGRHIDIDVRANQMTGDELNILASAALDIALEEAARVAEGMYKNGQIGPDIAAAIRALKSNGGGNG